MSEYAEIVIGKLSLGCFRNYLDSGIVSLFFSKKDLVVSNDCKMDDDIGTYTKYVYRTTVQCAKERLDALGYGLNNFEKEFEVKMLQAIDYSSFLYNIRVVYDEYDKYTENRIKKYISFRKWKNAIKKIVRYELANGNIESVFFDGTISDVNITTECDKVIFYSLINSNSESFYAINTEIVHLAFVYRLILEYCEEDAEIELDFSNLSNWDYDCIPKALAATEDVEKTIVLVEGTSDKDILEFSMSQLYPHLSDLFYFMDFDDQNGGKRDGGTSFVIKNLKTFYFSKIKTNFIAIFDNDAEGYNSKCMLQNEIKNWPSNFRILLYPEVELFRKYPTISPNQAIVFDNINRKAASIELYLPDFIISSNEGYYPIEWESRKRIKNVKGVEEALYQGVISHKDDIKRCFHEVRNKIEDGDGAFQAQEWKRMKKLLETIVFAFNKE